MLLRRAIRLLFFLLGWFEIILVIRFLTKDSITLQNENKFYPTEFFRFPVRYILILFTFFIGLIRLIWSVGDNTFPAWMFITAAHIGETIFLWTCARLPHFNPFRHSLMDLIQRVAILKAGNAQSRFVLFFVPVLVVLLLLHGPGDSRVTTKVKTHSD